MDHTISHNKSIRKPLFILSTQAKSLGQYYVENNFLPTLFFWFVGLLLSWKTHCGSGTEEVPRNLGSFKGVEVSLVTPKALGVHTLKISAHGNQILLVESHVGKLFIFFQWRKKDSWDQLSSIYFQMADQIKCLISYSNNWHNTIPSLNTKSRTKNWKGGP